MMLVSLASCSADSTPALLALSCFLVIVLAIGLMLRSKIQNGLMSLKETNNAERLLNHLPFKLRALPTFRYIAVADTDKDTSTSSEKDDWSTAI